MRIGTLFDLFTDAKDLCALFENVETKDQLVSRLEVLKHKDTDELLGCLAGTRASLDHMYKETFEMSATVSEGEIEDLTEGDDEIDQVLSDVEREFPDESQESMSENPISPSPVAVADPKSGETPKA